MGTFLGHILPGSGFVLLGLWHLYSIVGVYLRSPWTYKTRTWFPPVGLGRRFRHVELYFIIAGACGSIAGELLPDRFWSVTKHLNNFEHSTISLTLLLYATFALAIDTFEIHVMQGWLHAAAAIALSEELLLFHFHSADHMGLEGHYHALLQLPIAIGILALLLEIFILHLPVIGVVRSMSFILQGALLVLMGFILWTPSFVPSGCYITAADRVDCPTPATLMEATALANLEFAWLVTGVFFLTGAVLIAMSAYSRKSFAYRHLDADEHLAQAPSLGKTLLPDVERGRGSSPSSGSQNSMELRDIDRVNLER